MNKLNFNSQICTTKEQSQCLLDLGLKPETADCQYAALVIDWKGNPISSPKWRFYDHNKGFIVQNFEQMECIPAWSLHRLIEMCNKIQFGMTISIYNDEVTVDGDLFEVFDNTYDNLISVIEWLIKRGHFKKEYLKQ